ncbi:MAG TPA: hypothetical protein PKE47_15405, partial [Verrucomicrobiota bacterium]|nr:hypothetical protein [Verrucomicrobiota bacterium]
MPRAFGVLGLAVLLACAAGCRIPRRAPPPDTTDLLLSPQEERLADAHARFAAGILAELEDEPEAALTNYLASLDLDPANDRLAVDIARRLLEQRRPEEAVAILRRSAGRPGASGDIQAWLGVTLSLTGQREAAETALREA